MRSVLQFANIYPAKISADTASKTQAPVCTALRTARLRPNSLLAAKPIKKTIKTMRKMRPIIGAPQAWLPPA